MHLILTLIAAFGAAAASPRCANQLQGYSRAAEAFTYLSQPGTLSAILSLTTPRDKVDLLTNLGGVFVDRKIFAHVSLAAAVERGRGVRTVAHDLFAAAAQVARTLPWTARRNLVRQIIGRDDDARIEDCDFDGPPTDRFVNALIGRDLERLLGQTRGHWAHFGREHVHLNRDLVFLTMPYIHLRRIFAHFGLKPGSRLIDLGSGEGGVGMVVGLTHPDVDFLGLELVPERVRESARVARGLGLSRVRYWIHDLSRQTLPDADTYFAFNPVSEDTARIIVADLRRIARRRKLRLLATKNSASLIDALDPSWIHQAGEAFPALWQPVLQFEN